jgi:hypothetical protein
MSTAPNGAGGTTAASAAAAAGTGSDTGADQSAAQLAPWMRQRRFVIKEIISSEKSYIDYMDILVDVFVRPSSPLLRGDVHKAIFRDIDFIRNLNQRLLADLQTAFGALPYERAWTMGVGQIMIRFAPFLNMYMEYYTGHDQALELIKGLWRDRHHAATKLWVAAVQDPRCNGSSLEFLLIMPIQRIPRYVLLLKSLLEHTPEAHMPTERAQCEDALREVREVAQKMDHAVEVRQAKLALLEVKREFKPELEFLNVEHPRLLLLRDYVKLMDAASGYKRHVKGEHLAVLFSDMLVVGRKMHGGTHVMEEHLSPAMAEGDPDTRYITIAGHPCTADMNATVRISLEGRPMEDYDQWLRLLSKVCAAFKEEDMEQPLPDAETPHARRPGGVAGGGFGQGGRSMSLHTGEVLKKGNHHPAIRRIGSSNAALSLSGPPRSRAASLDGALMSVGSDCAASLDLLAFAPRV